jgi:hypothetical protein
LVDRFFATVRAEDNLLVGPGAFIFHEMQGQAGEAFKMRYCQEVSPSASRSARAFHGGVLNENAA